MNHAFQGTWSLCRSCLETRIHRCCIDVRLVSIGTCMFCTHDVLRTTVYPYMFIICLLYIYIYIVYCIYTFICLVNSLFIVYIYIYIFIHSRYYKHRKNMPQMVKQRPFLGSTSWHWCLMVWNSLPPSDVRRIPFIGEFHKVPTDTFGLILYHLGATFKSGSC